MKWRCTDVDRVASPASAPNESEPVVSSDRRPSSHPPLLLTVLEVAGLLGVGRTTVYELISAGDLEVVHIGRSARVPAASVHDYVAGLRGRARR